MMSLPRDSRGHVSAKKCKGKEMPKKPENRIQESQRKRKEKTSGKKMNERERAPKER